MFHVNVNYTKYFTCCFTVLFWEICVCVTCFQDNFLRNADLNFDIFPKVGKITVNIFSEREDRKISAFTIYLSIYFKRNKNRTKALVHCDLLEILGK